MENLNSQKPRRRRERREKTKIDTDRKEITLEKVLPHLQRRRSERTTANNKIITKYLCDNIAYFKKLKSQSDNEKLDKIISVLNYEVFEAGQKIINCGDEGDKFYVLLNGKVGVYKPFPKEEKMTFREYVHKIAYTRDIENNYSKFKRLCQQNPEVDYYALKRINFNTSMIRDNRKKPFVMEEDKKLAEFGNGFAFGEMALIKNEPRNATIIAHERSELVSIEKLDYNHIIREIEEKRLRMRANEFKTNYPLFENWGNYRCLRLFNYFQKNNYIEGEYLYRQGDASDGIYLISNGSFEMYSNISLAWYEGFISYINDDSYSLVNKMDDPGFFTEEKLKNFMNEANEKLIYDFPIINSSLSKLRISNLKASNLINLKLEEDFFCSNCVSFKALIRRITKCEVVGLEDSIEMKKRFCSVRVTSTTAEVQKVALKELLLLLQTDMINQFTFQREVFEKKKFLIQQIKNKMVSTISTFEDKMAIKYKEAIKIKYPNFYKRKPQKNEKRFNKQLSLAELKKESNSLILDNSTSDNLGKITSADKPSKFLRGKVNENPISIKKKENLNKSAADIDYIPSKIQIMKLISDKISKDQPEKRRTRLNFEELSTKMVDFQSNNNSFGTNNNTQNTRAYSKFSSQNNESFLSVPKNCGKGLVLPKVPRIPVEKANLKKNFINKIL